MQTNKLHSKSPILNLQTEFGIKRTSPMTFKKFFFTCVKSKTNPERIAAWMGITKSEYSEFTDTSTLVWRWMLVVLMVILTGVFVIIGVFGTNTFELKVFAICAAPIVVLIILLIYFMRRIDHGLLFHAMNYNYISNYEI